MRSLLVLNPSESECERVRFESGSTGVDTFPRTHAYTGDAALSNKSHSRIVAAPEQAIVAAAGYILIEQAL